MTWIRICCPLVNNQRKIKFKELIHHYYTMSDIWWGITKENQLKKLHTQVNQFINELELSLKDFENNGDVKKLGYELKEAIQQFQKEIKS